MSTVILDERACEAGWVGIGQSPWFPCSHQIPINLAVLISIKRLAHFVFAAQAGTEGWRNHADCRTEVASESLPWQAKAFSHL